MASVLITRPHSSAEDLAQELRHLGYKTITSPLLHIAPTGIAYPAQQPPAQAIMITSGNVFNVPWALNPTPLFNLPCFCVGRRTAQKAAAFGFLRVYDTDGDGNQLADFIRKTLPDRNTSILHLAGRYISSNAYDSLVADGYRLIMWPLYEAVPLTTLPAKTISAFKERQFDATLVYSSRTAETLCQLIADNQLEACCNRLIAIGLSSAIRDVLKSLPWKVCISATAPTEESIVTCLKEICPAS